MLCFYKNECISKTVTYVFRYLQRGLLGYKNLNEQVLSIIINNVRFE